MACSKKEVQGTGWCLKHQRSKTRRPRWTDERRQQFIRLWNSEVPLWEVATKMDRSRVTMRSMARFLRLKGYKLRQR
jgi:hypothetical protein